MYDVAVIGAGIVGTAIARELSKYDLSAVVLEKTSDIANGATKANSGIVHAGYDAKEGSLKAKLNVQGNEMYENLCSELDVHFRRNGSLVVAFNQQDMETVKQLYDRGIKNGVKRLEIIDSNRVKEMEPNLSRDIVGALYAPSAGIVSPYDFAVALAENASQNGVEFRFSTEVKNIRNKDEHYLIVTDNGDIESRFLVNASGLYADDINKMLNGKSFKIIPRRGEYCLFDKTQGKHVNSVIFQTPTARGKGILVTPTVHGNLLIGPNAIENIERDDMSTTSSGITEVIDGARKSTENLNIRDVITSFTGVRATPDTGDFVINIPQKGAVNAAGIESPGLTAAPAIALMVLELLKSDGLELIKKKNFISKRLNAKRFIDMNDNEKRAALAENPLYGRVVCRCEHVTEGDIINAIKRPLGARTVDGVKKRLRAGMGRCQGGFCMPRVVEILARELGIDQQDVMKAETGSYIITGKTK